MKNKKAEVDQKEKVDVSIKIGGIPRNKAEKIAGDVLKSKGKHAPEGRGTILIAPTGVGKIGTGKKIKNIESGGNNKNGEKKK